MKYYLHYAGSNLYPKEVFIKEVEKYGVNRCLPINIIQSLKWGDKIFLAIYKPKEVGIITDLQGKQSPAFDGRKNKKEGTAEIFGYFVISGLNIIASSEFKKTLTSQLDIVESKEVNQTVQRQCGSYIYGSSHTVNNSIEDIIKKAKELNKTEQFALEKIKFFVAGQFYPLNLIIEPINFTRTVIPVEITKYLTAEDIINSKVLGTIEEYNKRCYIKKYEKRGRPKKEKLNG
jgi:hypothetical protein